MVVPPDRMLLWWIICCTYEVMLLDKAAQLPLRLQSNPLAKCQRVLHRLVRHKGAGVKGMADVMRHSI